MTSSERDYWDAEAPRFDDEPDHGLRDPQVHDAWRSLLIGLTPPIPSRVADLGCGTGTLALLDGRSLYQDFFGFVMWDFLPVNLNEIKQVEVIRGPASAVWGANALNGVVNVITKSPREMQGTSAILGVGGFDPALGPVRVAARADHRVEHDRTGVARPFAQARRQGDRVLVGRP